MSQKAVTVLIFCLVGMLSTVILVGLITKSLDTTSVALTLITGMCGIVTGAILRSRSDKSGGEDE